MMTTEASPDVRSAAHDYLLKKGFSRNIFCSEPGKEDKKLRQTEVQLNAFVSLKLELYENGTGTGDKRRITEMIFREGIGSLKVERDESGWFRVVSGPRIEDVEIRLTEKVKALVVKVSRAG